jgi:DNA-binding CsgD family transcriptional regulator
MLLPCQPEIESIRLTPREREVLLLIAQGKSNGEAAEQLFVSVRTIHYHLYYAYAKLDVTNRLEAVRRALELGLISLDT